MEPTLTSILGYQFQDESLLSRALTHSSASAQSYERLEFLGDAILGAIVADMLYRQYPAEKEGRLSRMRASIVNQDSLAKIALKSGLNEHVVLGESEIRAGGRDRQSILADVVEAVIGALYLDGGLAACQQFVHRWFKHLIETISIQPNIKDPKSTLQEWAQAKHLPLPIYQVLNISGKAHQQTFEVSCQVDSLEHQTTGKASSRRKAEQQAAKAYLELLNND